MNDRCTGYPFFTVQRSLTFFQAIIQSPIIRYQRSKPREDYACNWKDVASAGVKSLDAETAPRTISFGQLTSYVSFVDTTRSHGKLMLWDVTPNARVMGDVFSACTSLLTLEVMAGGNGKAVSGYTHSKSSYLCSILVMCSWRRRPFQDTTIFPWGVIPLQVLSGRIQREPYPLPFINRRIWMWLNGTYSR